MGGCCREASSIGDGKSLQNTNEKVGKMKKSDRNNETEEIPLC